MIQFQLCSKPCNPEGLEVILKCVLHEPRRARGDDEASVARSAARGAYRHHHSTQHCAAHGAEGIDTRLNIVHRRGAQLGPSTPGSKCLEEELCQHIPGWRSPSPPPLPGVGWVSIFSR